MKVGLIFCDSHLADGKYQDLLAPYGPRVVVMSRGADWEEFREAMQWGAFDVISAPCRPTDVEWMVIQAKRQERKTENPGPARVERSELTKGASASEASG